MLMENIKNKICLYFYNMEYKEQYSQYSKVSWHIYLEHKHLRRIYNIQKFLQIQTNLKKYAADLL